ncbi:peritrophin-1-like [Spodoptera frugiperda]|uniref:Peritrophin-1-like n=1 Tax=Spodoptera frugiperda TaxID=7108 RepID=A0A9R0EA91_SPOFR|nr:peritrophin-1-like [Spodoptera frugiperda]
MKVLLFFMLCVVLVYAKSASLCPETTDGGVTMIPHEFCNQFYVCSSGHRFEMTCPAGLWFDTERQQCNFPHMANCEGRIVP